MAECPVDETQSAQVPIADFDARLWARVIDWAILRLVSVALWGLCYLAAVVSKPWSPPFALLLALSCAWFPIYIAYFTLFTARSGQTPGKRFMGTQVQDASAQVPATRTCLWRATADCFFYCLGVVLVGLLDYVWVLQRKDRRAWHDLLAGTSVRQIRPTASGKAATAVIAAAAAVLLLATSPHSEVARTGWQQLDNMAPTISKGETWEADRLAYRHHPPAVGDLVVFRDWPTGEFVGRVVGLAGDRLRYQQRRVEKVLPTAEGLLPQGAAGIPAGAVAVLGDNRTSDGSASFPNPRPEMMPPPPPGTSALPAPRPPAGAGNARDNAAIRTVRLADVEGRAVGVIWPLSHLRALR